MLKFKQFLNEVRLSIHYENPTTSDFEHRLDKSINAHPDEIKELSKYGANSKDLNAALLYYHHLNSVPPKNLMGFDLNALDSATNKRLGRSVVVYHGLGFDPTQQIKNNKLFMPGYTSTSMEKSVGRVFSKSGNDGKFTNMLKISLNPNDTGGTMAKYPDRLVNERELVLPRNTVFRVHRSGVDKEDPTLMVHHVTIDNETDPHEFIGTPEGLKHIPISTHMYYLRNKQNHDPNITKHILPILKDDLYKKLLSDRVGVDEVNNAKEHNYWDDNLHGNLVKEQLLEQLKNNKYSHNLIDIAIITKCFTAAHKKLLHDIILNKIQQNKADAFDLFDAKDWGILTPELQAAAKQYNI